MKKLDHAQAGNGAQNKAMLRAMQQGPKAPPKVGLRVAGGRIAPACAACGCRLLLHISLERTPQALCRCRWATSQPLWALTRLQLSRRLRR